MIIEAIEKRRSIRSYADRPVDRATIDRCLEAARLSPSAHNSQPWRFVVADEATLKNRVAEKLFTPGLRINSFASEAPVIVAVAMVKNDALLGAVRLLKRKNLALIDIGIAAEHFCLQATAEGLGTCMIGWFDEAGVRRALGVPRGVRIPLLITLGYPNERGERSRKRKPMETVAAYNGWFKAT